MAQAAGVSQALIFYHFATKERLLAEAFEYAAEQDLVKLDRIVRSPADPLRKLRMILRLYEPTGSLSWPIRIDGWAESLRTPEVERMSRRLDLRWKDAIAEIIVEGCTDGTFVCDDPVGAAWRIIGLLDGLAVQVAVHKRVISRQRLRAWVRLAVARELGLEPDDLV